MSNYDIRIDILQIAINEGYKGNNENGRFYIDNGKYRIYIANAKLYKDKYSDSSISKDLVFEWVVKKDKGNGTWEQIGRRPVKYKTMYLESSVKRDLATFKSLGYLGLSDDNMGIDLNKELTKIAKIYLYIDTLEEQHSDSLDFHDVSVWGVEAALKAAFDLGKEIGYKMGK